MKDRENGNSDGVAASSSNGGSGGGSSGGGSSSGDSGGSSGGGSSGGSSGGGSGGSSGKMKKSERLKAKADQLLKEGDRLAKVKPAESRRLLRKCLYYRRLTKIQKETEDNG